MVKKYVIPKLKGLCTAALIIPAVSQAHMIAITATKPFPASIAATASASATFTVTNITSRANITVVDQSNFPAGLTISSSTCGTLLGPKQSCTINLSLQAPATGQRIVTALKEWAKPTADGVQYPIVIDVIPSPDLPAITLVPVNTSQIPSLPKLRDPIIGMSGNNWLILSGSTGNFHDFNQSLNTNIYVFNPVNSQIYSIDIASTDLDNEIKKQCSSSSPQFLQDGDTLYIIGGYYTADNLLWTTLQTITAINVPQMINAVIAGQTNLNQYTHVRTDIPQFKVIGGQIGKINNYFYLVYGQACADGGSYCDGQIYTNSIYQFTTDPTLSSTTIVNTVTHADGDGSGWRRRDYTLVPFIQGATQKLFAMAGPFTPGNDALVWTNGISINGNLTTNDRFNNQQANQYATSALSMYSASSAVSYVATFSGLSNLYWATNGLQYSNDSPYGNILDLVRTDATGAAQEYINFQPLCSGQPLASCLYMGLGAQFVPVTNYYDSRAILLLDQLPKNVPTLVGYVYGGLLSPVQDIFSLPPPPNPPSPPSPSYATNNIYAVYVTPSKPGAVNWKNVTNLFPGN